MSHSCVLHIALTSWKACSLEMEGDDFPHQALPFRRGHLAPLSEFFSKKTGPQTHACIIPLYAPPTPLVWLVFFFACVKLQLYRCSAGNATLTDRHARGQPSTCVRHKDLSCLTTGCPAQHVALVTNTRSFSTSRLHLRRGIQRTVEGAFQDERQSGFLFQRAVDVHGSRILVFAVR